MRPRSVSLLAGSLLLLACAPTLRAQEQPPPPPTDPNRTFTLEAKYAAGDLLTYKFQMNSTLELSTASGQNPFPGGEMAMNAVMRMKTAGVKPDGTAVVSMQMQNAQMTMMGQTMPVPEVPAMTMEMDRRGRTTMRAPAAGGSAAMMGQMMNFNRMPSMGVVLPDHPVKVGDTWESEIPIPVLDQKAKAVCTLIAVEMVGGQETLKVKQVLTMPLNMNIGSDGQPTKDAEKAMMTMTGEFTTSTLSNILPANARLLKTIGDIQGGFSMTMKGDAAKQSPFGEKMDMKMNGKMTMELTSAGKVKPAPVKPAVRKPVTGGKKK